MTEEHVPDFAIFQNSRTRQSAIWTKQHGWQNCTVEEYPAMALMADMLRDSGEPEMMMKMIAALYLGGTSSE